MSMHILFCVYHNLNSEERSRELLEIFSELGDIDIVSRTPQLVGSNKHIKSVYASEYVEYIRASIKLVIRSRYDLFVLHDNYDSLLIPFIRGLHRNAKIIYDSSEFYPLYELANTVLPLIIKLKSCLLAVCEKWFIRKTDVVIATNRERASIMKRYYRIEKDIVVYDNMHYIVDEYNMIACEEKYSRFFNEGKFTILNAGGIAVDRYIYEISNAVADLGDDYMLLIVGGGDEGDIKQFANQYRDIDNIKYLGFVPRNELKFLIQKANVCFTGFKPTGVNNIYCASGKTYESLMEGTPILCSDNPPLRKLCSNFGVGIASNDFKSAVVQIRHEYETYKKNALLFKEKSNYLERHDQLICEIRSVLNI